MASTVWDTSPIEAVGLPSGLAVVADPLVDRLRGMDAIRDVITRVVVGEGHATEPTCDQWEELWAAAQGVDNEAEGLALVVMAAYRLRDRLARTSGFDPVTSSPRAAPQNLGGGRDSAGGPRSAGPAEGPMVANADLSWPLRIEPITPPTPPAQASPTSVRAGRRQRARWADRTRLAVAGIASILPAPRRAPSKRLHARRGGLDEAHRARWLTFSSWILHTGIIILLFVGWQLWGTAITQYHDQSALKNQFAAKVHHVAAKPPPLGFTLTPATARMTDPAQGTVMAQLQIPKISLDQYVVSGTNEDDLAKGPGHYLGTAMPGQAGNVAIAGHRTTHGAPFNHLAELTVGDPIYLTTTAGQRLTYIVSATPVPVSPTDVTVLNNFGDNRLTLTTCNPEYSAVQRLIVVAAYLPPGAHHPTPIATGTGTPYRMSPAVTSGWNMKLVPLVLIEFAAVFALGLLYRRLAQVYGREGRFLILVPIWIGVLFALFETLSSFLPASV